MFDEDVLLRRAAEAILTRLGEAARRVPEPFREAHPEIPWPPIIAMRNRATHEYDRLDYDVVWSTLEVSVPDLGGLLDALPDVTADVSSASARAAARPVTSAPECGFLT